MPPRSRGKAQTPSADNPEEEVKRKIVSVGFPPELLRELGAYAMIMGTSANDVIRVLAEEGLARAKKSPEFRRKAQEFLELAHRQVAILTDEQFDVKTKTDDPEGTTS